MKKKIFAVFMIVAMLLCFMPSAAFAVDGTADNGVVFSKTAEKNADGSVEITMKAYTTGKKVTSSASVPVDIVLVLDQSGSMKDPFGTVSRQAAMKDAVANFISDIDPNGGHRVAIVKFGSDANTIVGWTEATEAGKGNLINSVNSLPKDPSGATNVAAGMAKASGLLNSANAGSQKVVIVFTDGVPTTSNEFSTEVADNAIAVAKGMKDDGVKVYTIGIFNGADPTQLYGEKADYAKYEDVTCSGEVGSVWGGNFLSDLFGGDVRNDDIPAGNRFLNYLSNNFLAADCIGIKYGNYNPGKYFLGNIEGYKITQNFKRSDSKYYLTASDASELSNVFEKIQSETMIPAIELDGNTKIVDTISDYFSAPTEVKVYTADYSGSAFDEVNLTDVTEDVNVTVAGKTVAVDGFNFNENYISSEARKVNDQDFYGRELIVKIKVSPIESAIDSAISPAESQVTVPTNTNAQIVKENETVAEAPSPKISYPVYNYVLNYDANGGTAGTVVHQKETTVSAAHTFTILTGAVPTREKYEFLGWADSSSAEDAAYSVGSSVDLTSGNNSKTLYAVWAPNPTPIKPVAAAYIVEHYLKGDDGQYVLEDTERLVGNIDAEVTAQPKTYEGYYCNKAAEGTVETGIVIMPSVDQDQSLNILTLKLYYDKYTNPTPIEPVAAAYIVEHYLKGDDGQYVLKDTERLVGNIDAEVTAQPKTYEGYYCNKAAAGTVEKGIVVLPKPTDDQAPEILTLKLYYDKNTSPWYPIITDPEGPGEIEIPDPDVPLGPGEVDEPAEPEEPEEPEDPIVIVEEPEVPLDDAPATDVPKTGDNGFGTAGILFFLSAAGLTALAVTGRKEEETE